MRARPWPVAAAAERRSSDAAGNVGAWLRKTSGPGFVVVSLVIVGAGAILFRGGNGSRWASNLGVVIATTSAGFLLSLILFMSVDDDMKGLKTLLIGALSGTTLASWKPIVSVVRTQFGFLGADAASQHLMGGLFFLSLAGGLLGLVGGFLLIRLRLEPELVRAKTELAKLLEKVPEIPVLPWPEFSEEWPTVGQMPDDATVKALMEIKDWSQHPIRDAVRAAAVLLKSKQPQKTIDALQYAVCQAEPPSPIAFDLYVAALAELNQRTEIPQDKLREFERVLARMLTYLPNSFLVCLDAGFLYLYVPGKEEMAVYYCRKALEQRPDSAVASLNMACAMAKVIGARAPAADEVAQVIHYLENYLARNPANGSRINREGDFEQLIKNSPAFQQWMATHAK